MVEVGGIPRVVDVLVLDYSLLAGSSDFVGIAGSYGIAVQVLGVVPCSSRRW